MKLVADEALAAGCEVIGVIPRWMAKKGVVHEGLTHLEIVDTMHERKARMCSLADGFVALPGGFGTLEELLEIITWVQLGLVEKPVGILNPEGFFDPFLTLVERAIADGLVRPENRRIFVCSAEPGELLDRLEHHRPPPPLVSFVE